MDFNHYIDQLLALAERARSEGKFAELDSLLSQIETVRQAKIDYLEREEREGSVCPRCGIFCGRERPSPKLHWFHRAAISLRAWRRCSTIPFTSESGLIFDTRLMLVTRGDYHARS